MTDTVKIAKAESSIVESALDEKSRAPSAAKTVKSKLLGGSLTLLAGSGLVGVTNLVYNVATARLLGPKAPTECVHEIDDPVWRHNRLFALLNGAGLLGLHVRE